jgi:nitrogen regulatory protein P-II 1
MKLLVCVINHEEKLEEILTGFLELGVTGATVFKTEGMGRVLSQEVPVLAGLQALLSRSRPQNVTLMSVIESAETLDHVVALIRRICGDLNQPSTGILFTLPVDWVEGLAPELDTSAE